MDFFSIFITLFLIMDPFGNIPIFLSVLEKVDPKRRRKVLIRELFFALFIIIITALTGKHIISFLGLRQESISIAGGIILFLISIKMIFPYQMFKMQDDEETEPFIVPLAIPLIVGPSLLAVMLLFSSAHAANMLKLIMAGSLAWLVTFIILLSSTFLVRFLKKKGLVAAERLMGMILVALSVQLFLDGISRYLNQ